MNLLKKYQKSLSILMQRALKGSSDQGQLAPADPFHLDSPLLSFSPYDQWTIRDAAEGVQIFGAIGSGKTSGSGETIAKSFLRHDFGGIVLCAKPEEKELWEKYAKETGRTDSLIIFSPEQSWKFNFLNYELTRAERGGGQTENLVQLLAQIIEIVEARIDTGGGDLFWSRAKDELLRNAIELLSIAEGTITLKDVCDLITSGPQSLDDVLTEEEFGETKYGDWWKKSSCGKRIIKARTREKTPAQAHDFSIAETYWTSTFPALSDRTRSNIVSTFTSVADMLLHGSAYQLLCTETSLVPEVTYKNGAIIVLDLPIQQFQAVGRMVQGIFKYMFQKAILRRKVSEHPRPVFLWADESQNFVSSFDYQVQAVARSAKLCTVYLTQNISNYYAVLGAKGRDETNALLGNFQTKIFHANGEYNTNQYAADLIGQHWIMKPTPTTDRDGRSSVSVQETLAYKVLPEEFTRLKKGGPHNQLQVEGIVFQGGRVWNTTGNTYTRAIFQQEQSHKGGSKKI